MKKIKLIYNPNSGDKTFKINLDMYIDKLQQLGYEIHVFRLNDINIFKEHIKNLPKDFYEYFIISGGDGTLNLLINCLMKYNLAHIPIAIIPSGTANDFASFLKLPKSAENIAKIIEANKYIYADVGLVNDMYFINVCAGGIFANVGENLDLNFKKKFGKFAYYIKALEKMHAFSSMELKITTNNEVIQDKFDLFIVLNSSGTGGLEKLSPKASINDGLFDFIAFKNVSLSNLPKLFIKAIKGDFSEKDKILFLKDSNIKLELLSEESIACDLDGEKGPFFPLDIKNIKNAIKILTFD